MQPLRLPSFLLPLFALLLPPSPADAHPEPDVPVRSFFQADGSAVIQVEVDTRCLSDNPTDTAYLINSVFALMTEQNREILKKEADAFAKRTVAFYFDPLGKVEADFTWTFTTFNNAPLSGDEDPVMVTGEWRTKVPAGLDGYRIEALSSGKLSVVFKNEINGAAVQRVQVLFPGEKSFLLDLTAASAPAPTGPVPGSVGVDATSSDWWSLFWEFIRQGFVHVLPRGLDHILFVLGVFLLSRKLVPLIWQVTMFTLAHTLTLGLATMGIVNVPSSIVEPIIAASIAVVALENIFHPKYTHWRLIIVFVFGLIHGLGFAGALSALDLPPASLVVGLLGFNIGVEGGQLAVIALALVATFWIRDPKIYRNFVVIPGSLAIAAMGIWWTIERVFF